MAAPEIMPIRIGAGAGPPNNEPIANIRPKGDRLPTRMDTAIAGLSPNTHLSIRAELSEWFGAEKAHTPLSYCAIIP
jgi:hypothetical protein